MEHSTIEKMFKVVIKLTGFVLVVFAVTSCYYDNEEYLYPDLPGGECDTTGITYAGFVAPLLAANCNTCHSEAAPQGNVVTSTYDGLKIVVNSGQFRKAINHEQGALPMPQNGSKLSSCNLKKIDAWINQGAPQN